MAYPCTRREYLEEAVCGVLAARLVNRVIARKASSNWKDIQECVAQDPQGSLRSSGPQTPLGGAA